MYLVGLTGGIGSGKTTVARRFAELGAELIDADAVAREVVAPGQPTLAALAEHFGETILQPDGTLDRAALAGVAFATDDGRAALDRITHPHIAARIAHRVAQLAASELRGDGGQGAGGDDGDDARVVVVDHPLLIETGQTGRFDAVVVVLAPEAERIRRVVTERGLDGDDVRRRMRAQTDDDTRRRAATHVIVNDADHEALVAAAGQVYEALRSDARTAAGRVTGRG